MSTLQFRERIHERAARGEALTDDEVEEITRESAELAGADSGESLTYHNITLQTSAEDRPHSRDVNTGPTDVVDPLRSQWASRSDQILHKPANTINQTDARELHSKEVLSLSYPFWWSVTL